MLVLAYNATPSDATGYSPYFLLFGRNPRLPVDNLFPRETQTKIAKEVREAMNWAWSRARDTVDKNKSRQKTYHDRKIRGAVLIPENDLEVEVSESEEEEEAAAYIRQRASQPPREVTQPPREVAQSPPTPAARRSTRIRQPPMWMRTNEYVTDHNPVIDALLAVISGTDVDATAIIQHFLSRDNGSRTTIS
ncbi:Pol polyprotein [Plakobranchus ocellatus]|uniref:Pol polyprotein n=1 Tax=Plakobranchus ocellatus TaxID=259542 RepID=A0AAV4B3B8_9GAST|nr:Pol polyprotein [Plakobranchus ocellatus]